MYAGSHWMYVAHHSISMQEPTIYINVSTGSQPWIGCTGYTRHIGRELQLHTSTISYRVLAKLKYRKRTNKSWRIKALHEQNIVQTEKIYNKMIFNISRFYVSKLFIRQTNGGHRMTLVWIFFPHFLCIHMWKLWNISPWNFIFSSKKNTVKCKFWEFISKFICSTSSETWRPIVRHITKIDKKISRCSFEKIKYLWISFLFIVKNV